MSLNRCFNARGITLIELLIAIAVAGILTGVVALTLQTSLDTYHAVENDVFLQKVLDDTLQILAAGDYEHYGVKDSLEVVDAGEEMLRFVPPWVDDSHITRPSGREPHVYTLNRPLKAGAGNPVGEIHISKGPVSRWQTYPLIFYFGENENESGEKAAADSVAFKGPVPLGQKARFTFYPDVSDYPEAAMTVRYEKRKIFRSYAKREDAVPKNSFDVHTNHFRLQYFDNTNTEIKPDGRTGKIPPEQLTNITAVKISLDVELKGKTKTGSVFIGLRNSRSSGFGLVIRPDTKLRIPDSKHIRAFSLVNITGVKSGDRIRLRAVSDAGQSWGIDVELDVRDDKAYVRKYSIEYPTGSTVFSEKLQQTTELPLNMLTLGGNGRYDYDFDEDLKNNAVNLEGNVELSVVQMDPAGAALFIRP